MPEEKKNELTYFDYTKIMLEQRQKVKMIKQNEQRIKSQQKICNRIDEKKN